MNLTDSTTWSADDSAPSEILLLALRAYLNETDHGDPHHSGESNTLTRVIVTLIDPALYRGTAYGLQAGNKPHRLLFQHVSYIIETTAIPGRGAITARETAALMLADIAARWPDLRETILTPRTPVQVHYNK